MLYVLWGKKYECTLQLKYKGESCQLYWRRDKRYFVLVCLNLALSIIDTERSNHELNTLFKSIKATKIESIMNIIGSAFPMQQTFIKSIKHS